MQRPAKDGFVAMPAAYSEADQGYVVKMQLGRDNVLVVLDSGSAHLSVGTADCVKSELCSAHDGAYRPGASPQAVDTGVDRDLHYASLTVRARLWRDAVALPAVRLPASACAAPALEDADAAVGVNGLVDVAAAGRMDGTLCNILGLMARHAGQDATPAVEQLWAGLGVRRQWTLMANHDGSGLFVLGQPPAGCLDASRALRVPLSPHYAFMGAPVVDLHGMEYLRDGKWRPFLTHPRHAVVDTGTAHTYVTSKHRRAFDDARVADDPCDIRIVLATGDTILFTRETYVRDGVHMLACGHDSVDALFGDDDAMLVGVHAMVGVTTSVDAQDGVVLFSRAG